MRKPRYLRPYGPAAFVLEWEQRIAVDIGRSVVDYGRAARVLPGVAECVPAYASLLVRFDPRAVDRQHLGERLLQLTVDESGPASGTLRRLPVCYGGKFAPDLARVARACGIQPAELIELHSAPTYPVFFTGYRPGFPFLGPTHPRLRIARRDSPRAVVPSGSVGLADRQTGIYPTDSPGGWQLIGNCPLPMLLPDGSPRLAAGERVRFQPVSPEDHAAITSGTIEWNTASA